MHFYLTVITQMNHKKIERIAKAICYAAGLKNMNGRCIHCEQTDKYKCTMGPLFEEEALAAIREMEK
jgi:hypothetical protein